MQMFATGSRSIHGSTFISRRASGSWLNAVEGFFAKLTNKRLRRGVFSGIIDLQEAIDRFLAETNERPRPFVWTADADGIIERVRRGKAALAALG